MSNKYYKKTFGNTLFDIVNIIILCLFSFCVLYPFWNQLVLSFNEGTDAVRGGIYFWPRTFTLSNYAILFADNNLLKGAFISVLRVVVGTISCLFCTGLLSYVVTQKSFSGRVFVRRVFIITMFFSGGMIPTYLLMVKLKFINTFWVYIIPGLFNAYYMLLITSYMRQNIADAMIEAARIDGLREIGIYTRIVIPVSLPVFAAIAVYLAVGHWNSWFDVLIYNPDGQWDTLQVYLRRILLEVEAFQKIENAMEAQSKYRNLAVQTVRAATTMVVTIPIIIVYPFLQKYFISGITIGAVKE